MKLFRFPEGGKPTVPEQCEVHGPDSISGDSKTGGNKTIYASKTKCPDCFQCQGCSDDRCRLCRKHGCSTVPTLASTGFTYGEYLEWKRRKPISGV